MSLDKAIEYNKEYRKKRYCDKRDFDRQCRNHVSGDWYAKNKRYKDLKRIDEGKSKLKEYMKRGCDDR